MGRTFSTVAALVVTAALSTGGALAQTATVTAADIQSLQDSVFLAERDVSQLRSRDATRAGELQSSLDDLRDEVVYLKVKLRKERVLSRNEVTDVRNRIEDVRTRARSDTPVTLGRDPVPSPAAGASTAKPAPPAPTAPAGTSTARNSPPAPPPAASSPRPPQTVGTTGALNQIPSGTEIDVRLQSGLDSGTATVEDRFEATTIVDMIVDGQTLVPAGSVMRGIITAVEPATRTNRTARLTVNFDRLEVRGRTYDIRGTVTEAIEGEGIKGEAVRIGAGAGVGAIIGGILGGVKGAIAGVLIGGGGTIAATEGKEVELPQGTVLRVRFDSPVDIRAR